VFGVLVAIIVIYAAALAYLWVTQRSHVFRPGAGPLDLAGSMVASHMREVVVGSADGPTLIAWYAEAKPGRRTIVYFHGNAGTLAGRDERVWPYLQHGYGMLLVGYRGYGGNPGLPTEPGLYEDGRAHLDWLARQGIEGDALVLFGESLGTAIAIQMATERDAAALVLEAPFASILHSARARYPMFAFDWLVKDKFASISKIDRIRMPLLVIHGALDRVTPQRFGRMLYERAPQPKFAVWLPEAGHNDLLQFGMVDAVTQFLDGLPPHAAENGQRRMPSKAG
jgi:hypothetical protein